jgi:uncharacterized iron-regulated membrane protein
LKKTSSLKHWIGKIHLWLGIGSGLIVFIVAITGCIYAFKVEIENMTQSYRFVEPTGQPVLPPSELKAVAEKRLPGKHIHAVLYSGVGKSAMVIFYNYEPDYYYYLIYLNPYTAEILKVKDQQWDFFQVVLDGHFYLWLPPQIGQPIVASATLVFVVMMISGIILWWPSKKGAAKQRFTIRWSARWRRKNYDLHNVLGFYMTWVGIILAVTGLVWGFEWFAKGYYTATGGEKSMVYADPVSDTTAVANADKPAIDRVWELMRADHPTAPVIEVHIPETNAASIAASANADEKTYWQTDYRYFDQYTLEEKSVDHIYGRLANADASDKLMRMNYDIHTGAIIGLPGKILAFFASLICASLPITGVIIWWGRKEKAEGKKLKAESGKLKGESKKPNAESGKQKATKTITV